MSIAFDAKQHAIGAYPELCEEGVDLFLSICRVSRDDFEYEESMTVEAYVYGKESE